MSIFKGKYPIIIIFKKNKVCQEVRAITTTRKSVEIFYSYKMITRGCFVKDNKVSQPYRLCQIPLKLVMANVEPSVQ